MRKRKIADSPAALQIRQRFDCPAALQIRQRFGRPAGRFAARLAAWGLGLMLLAQPAAVCAAQDNKAETRAGSAAAQEETTASAVPKKEEITVNTVPDEEKTTASTVPEEEAATRSLSDEELDKLLDFVKEKWNAGELEGEEAIRKAIEEGEEEFGVVLGDSVKSAIAKQVVEPAKEAVKTAVENTAKTFWQDLKNSVVSFFKNIFS